MKFSLLGFKVEISKASQLPETKHQAQAKPEYKELEPVINKPVREFVDTFLARPKTFSYKEVNAGYCGEPCTILLEDLVCRILFEVEIHRGFGTSIVFAKCNGKGISLTSDEQSFLMNRIGGYYADRKRKLYEIRQSRIRRDLSRIYA